MKNSHNHTSNGLNTIRKVKVLKIRPLTKWTYVLRTERKKFSFIPGQCVNIGLVGTPVNREYSTYSSDNEMYLEFLIKKATNGIVSTGISKLTSGDEVTLDGAYGRFTIDDPDSSRKYIFIGSGTGIAPFHSYIKSYPSIDYRIIHGIRNVSEQYDRSDYEKKRYFACVSRTEGGDFSGRVTDYLKSTHIPPKAYYYLCGNRSMINDVYDLLRERDINGSNIFTEVFF